MDILENIGEKLDRIWKIFDSALKGIEGYPEKDVEPVVQAATTSLLTEHKDNNSSFSQKHHSSQWLTVARPSGEAPLNIFHLLPQHPVPRDDIEDSVWASQPGGGYLCERCGVAQLGATTCNCSRHSTRRDLKQVIKSMLRGRGAEERRTKQTDTEQRQILAGDDKDQTKSSEEDMKKALRKVVRKKMTRHEACKLYGIPYEAFLNYERKLVVDGNKSSKLKRNNSSNLKRKSSNILYNRNDIKQNCDQTESPQVDAGGGDWARMLIEELEETVWFRPVKRIKLERTKRFINQ